MAARRKPAGKSMPPESRATRRPHTRPQPYKRYAASVRQRSYVNSLDCRRSILRRERSHDLLETWVAANRVPPGQQFQPAVSNSRWKLQRFGELLAGELLIANPGGNDRRIINDVGAIKSIAVDRQKVGSAPDLFHRLLGSAASRVDQGKNT